MSATTKYAAMSRRAAMTAAALTAMVALAGCNSGGAGGAAEGDMALGAPEGAKVTVVEYASVTSAPPGRRRSGKGSRRATSTPTRCATYSAKSRRRRPRSP